MTTTTTTVREMQVKAEMEGAQYTSGTWAVTIAGQRRMLRVELVPGYSGKDHLFDRVLSALDERLAEKSTWGSKAALLAGLSRARRGCGCDAMMRATVDD